MLRRLLLIVCSISVFSLAPAAAHAAQNGFVLGIESGFGSFGLDGSKIASTDPTGAYHPSMGLSFVNPLNDKSNYTLNLHLGWNILGHASVEAAIHATSWELFNVNRGGAGFIGGRATWWPMQLFMPKDRPYDAGVEFGSGFSIAGGPESPDATPFGMSGAYYQLGLTGEYRISPFLGFALNLRYFKPLWSKFYVDYDQNIGSATTGPGGGWTTVTVGINLHVPLKLASDEKDKKQQ